MRFSPFFFLLSFSYLFAYHYPLSHTLNKNAIVVKPGTGMLSSRYERDAHNIAIKCMELLHSCSLPIRNQS